MTTNSYFDGIDANYNPKEFVSRVKELLKSGMKYNDIAKAAGYETLGAFWRDYQNACSKVRFSLFYFTARAMLDNGRSEAETARALGISKSTLRSLLNEQVQEHVYTVGEIVDHLRKLVEETGMADVSYGVELEFHVGRSTLAHACVILGKEGYFTHGRIVALAHDAGKHTHIKVLCPPGTTLLLAKKALDTIQKDRM